MDHLLQVGPAREVLVTYFADVFRPHTVGFEIMRSRRAIDFTRKCFKGVTWP